MRKIQRITIDAMLVAVLVILGMIKIPSFIPGAEFQLSAPFAVLLAARAGFGTYMGIGVCASVVQLALGTHTIWNVVISMVFRITAGLIVTYFPWKRMGVFIAGPLGTLAARIVLAAMLGVSAWPLIAAAVPGMIFTAVSVVLCTPASKMIKGQIKNYLGFV